MTLIVTPEMIEAGLREAVDQTRPDWIERMYRAMRARERQMPERSTSVDLGRAVHHRFDPPLVAENVSLPRMPKAR